MYHKHRYLFSILAGLLGLALLVGHHWLPLPAGASLSVSPLLLAAFAALVVFTTTFGINVGGGLVSLLPMISLAAFLVLGLLPAGWLAFGGALAHEGIRRLFWRSLGEQPVDLASALGRGMVNAAIQSTSLLAGGWAYLLLGGELPLQTISLRSLPPLFGLASVYFLMNYFAAGVYLWTRSPQVFTRYLKSLPGVALMEGAPVIFAPLMALIYTRLGSLMFGLASLSMVSWSLITRGLVLARLRLERRVKELDSLQAVGKALTSSLDLDVILAAIHTQVSGLMDAENFYVALYDPVFNEVSFPLAIEQGQKVRWSARRTGRGLTEHVLNTRQPLLVPGDLVSQVRRLGLDLVGRPAECWLGVPLLAGAEPLGLIAVQNFDHPNAYDPSHLDLLVTIAGQASVAIQNASLYAQTDAALGRRVQELDSILRTTQDGILLVDAGWKVVAANPALARLVVASRSDFIGGTLHLPRADGSPPLAALLEYTEESLRQECDLLERGQGEQTRTVLALSSPSERHLERTLVPVRNRLGQVTAWLLVLRDITEEVKLARLREDTVHMLVHDLRSPLATLSSSLSTIQEVLRIEKNGGTTLSDMDKLVELAQRGTERMMSLVNQLLDINRYENGEFLTQPEPVEIGLLLTEVNEQFQALAAEAQVQLEVSLPGGLPLVRLDVSQITRVLVNLVDNAIKFTPNFGHVCLWARLEQDPGLLVGFPAGSSFVSGAILLGVSDDGPGIPLEAMPRLFQKFQRISGIKGRRLGTGLGLAFCKLAVEAHGGRIWADSQEGQGSTFVIGLPLEREQI